MKVTKKINFGEYIVVAIYDEIDGSLEVNVLDELGDIIEGLSITNDEDEDEEDNDTFNPSLN